MKAKILLVALALLLGSGGPAGAQSTRLISVLDFVNGVRAAGMAGAFVGLADDEQALLYNPAGLALLEGFQGQALLARRLGAATVGSLLGAMPSFGAGLMFYGVGGLVRRDANDQEGEAFGYGQLALLGAGALRLGTFIQSPALDNLSLGLRARFLSVNTLAEGSGATFALDPSALWELDRLRVGPLALNELRLGLALDNLGPGLGYGSGHRESVGLGARLGGSVRFEQDLTLALELDSLDGLHLGAEYGFPAGGGRLALRAGLLTRNGLTFALGLGFSLQDAFRVDYAFTSLPFGGSHQLALSLTFPGGL